MLPARPARPYQRLNTVDISGTKRFNDYGTGLAPTTLDQVQSSVKLKVQRSLDACRGVTPKRMAALLPRLSGYG